VSSTAKRGDLLSACRVLFGAEECAAPDFLARLDAQLVRRRFRTRAIELHPDRAAVLHRPPAALAEAFKQVEAAYRTLRAHLAAGTRVGDRASSGNVHGPAATPPACSVPRGPGRAAAPIIPEVAHVAGGDHFWSGPIPGRILRLGEFLYYSGRISWSELIRALVWQARQRPRFGQVAGSFGYLTPELVAAVLARRRAQEKIGEAALRLQLITSLQQQVVLQAQERRHQRIGDYFRQTGVLATADVESFGRAVRAHNARVAFAHELAG
jgi:hypothetical protein